MGNTSLCILGTSLTRHIQHQRFWVQHGSRYCQHFYGYPLHSRYFCNAGRTNFTSLNSWRRAFDIRLDRGLGGLNSSTWSIACISSGASFAVLRARAFNLQTKAKPIRVFLCGWMGCLLTKKNCFNWRYDLSTFHTLVGAIRCDFDVRLLIDRWLCFSTSLLSSFLHCWPPRAQWVRWETMHDRD